jgi:hypothetical protein
MYLKTIEKTQQNFIYKHKAYFKNVQKEKEKKGII